MRYELTECQTIRLFFPPSISAFNSFWESGFASLPVRSESLWFVLFVKSAENAAIPITNIPKRVSRSSVGGGRSEMCLFCPNGTWVPARVPLTAQLEIGLQVRKAEAKVPVTAKPF